jgi:hypothetical protein
MNIADIKESGWTLDAYIYHNEAMRVEASRFNEAQDRRYAEVNIEREKALKIKETADRDAMELAREAQSYKEKQNDTLRERTLMDSGVYATKGDLAKVADGIIASLKPLFDFVSSQGGSGAGKKATWTSIYGAVIATAAVITGIYYLIPHK